MPDLKQEGMGMTTHNAPPAVEERMDKLPPRALLRAARAMGLGMKYESGDWAHWRTQPAEYHLNRALRHARLWQSGDRSEDHISHVISRILMWGDMVE